LLDLVLAKDHLSQMVGTTHLKSLQALDMAIREGSLRLAAARLGITPAAVGQRIRAVEDFLGTTLLLRGRSGLIPSPQLDLVLADLRLAFDALERVTETLDFQRTSEIHIVADPDWAELWLLPRMAAFRREHPNILFCVNGAGDVPIRIGTPDLRIVYDREPGEILFRDVLVPVTGPDNARRVAELNAPLQMEGMPLLHLKSHRESSDYPGWVEWIQVFGHRAIGLDRGVHYQNARLALEAVRKDVGYLVCGLSLMLQDIEEGTISLLVPGHEHLAAPHPYRLRIREDGAHRPQLQKFIAWLRAEAARTLRKIEELAG
jgi:LysR family glycine cleavage system transcriptional activator